MKIFALLVYALCFCATISNAQSAWQKNLDSKIQFYQTTDFGLVLAGTGNSLYALDGQTGEIVWRKKTRGLDETSITPVPSTDLILISTDEGEKSRVEAVDLLSGESVWRSDKVKGDVMQLAVEPSRDLLAVVLVKKAKGKIGEEFKRTPIVHVFRLSSGDEIWKRELDSDVQMMPANFTENAEVPYTLDNYRAPLILDGRLYLFYEGATSFDVETGKEAEREKFQVNEDDLALTEADPVFDEKFLYVSGHGKIRAVNRKNYKVEWEANDFGVTPEMAIVGDVLFARTGGQFTRIKNGETTQKGSFGVSAIDAKNGKTLWRYKGADKGLTNFVFADAGKILIADRDDLITIDARTGKKISEVEHDVEKAQFVLINERGEAVVGGSEEIAAFQIANSRFQISDSKLQIGDIIQTVKFDSQNNKQSGIWNLESEIAVWRVKHKPPSRGVFRIVAGIALRATALYFRYGGLATSGLNLVRGASAARSILSLRWSGLQSRFGSFDLTTLAANSAKNYVSGQISVYGIASRNANLLNRLNNLQIAAPSNIRGRIVSGAINRVAPSPSEVQESLLDRLDPARQADRLADYFLRRKRLADLRGNYMYFYTDLPKPFDRKGLLGVNVHTGQDARFISVSEPDARFTIDETVGLLYSANGSQLQALSVLQK